MRRIPFIVVVFLVFVAACGRKEPPRLVAPDMPRIEQLQARVEAGALTLRFRLAGEAAGVGYEIDRTIMDPDCGCPGFWRRYLVQSPKPRLLHQTIVRRIDLEEGDGEFLFRIRAVDHSGRHGPWSRIIHTHIEGDS